MIKDYEDDDFDGGVFLLTTTIRWDDDGYGMERRRGCLGVGWAGYNEGVISKGGDILRALAGYVLRFAPVILPSIFVLGVVVGLSWELGKYPSGENVVFAAGASIICGVAPVSFLVGIVFLVMDIFRPAVWRQMIAVHVLLSCVVVLAGWFYGRGIVF